MKIIRREQTDMYKVRSFCCKNHLYTRGTSSEYDKLLIWVDEVVGKQLTDTAIYLICKNIADHSSRDWFGNLASLMYLFYKEAVFVSFDLDDELEDAAVYVDTDSVEYKEVLKA